MLSSRRLFTATANVLRVVELLNRANDGGIGGSTDSKQHAARGILVSGAPVIAGVSVDGFYAEEKIPGYYGAATFRKPGTDLVIYRWQHRFWLIGDWGPSMRGMGMTSEFGRNHTYCKVKSSANRPPTGGWRVLDPSKTQRSADSNGAGSRTRSRGGRSNSGDAEDSDEGEASNIKLTSGSLHFQASAPGIWQWCDASSGTYSRCLFINLPLRSCLIASSLGAGVDVWHRYDADSAAQLEAKFNELATVASTKRKSGDSNATSILKLATKNNACSASLDKDIVRQAKISSATATVSLRLPSGAYNVDIVEMTQTNVLKRGGRRKVRRLLVEDSSTTEFVDASFTPPIAAFEMLHFALVDIFCAASQADLFLILPAQDDMPSAEAAAFGQQFAIVLQRCIEEQHDAACAVDLSGSADVDAKPNDFADQVQRASHTFIHCLIHGNAPAQQVLEKWLAPKNEPIWIQSRFRSKNLQRLFRKLFAVMLMESNLDAAALLHTLVVTRTGSVPAFPPHALLVNVASQLSRFKISLYRHYNEWKSSFFETEDSSGDIVLPSFDNFCAPLEELLDAMLVGRFNHTASRRTAASPQNRPICAGEFVKSATSLDSGDAFLQKLIATASWSAKISALVERLEAKADTSSRPSSADLFEFNLPAETAAADTVPPTVSLDGTRDIATPVAVVPPLLTIAAFEHAISVLLRANGELSSSDKSEKSPSNSSGERQDDDNTRSADGEDALVVRSPLRALSAQVVPWLYDASFCRTELTLHRARGFSTFADALEMVVDSASPLEFRESCLEWVIQCIRTLFAQLRWMDNKIRVFAKATFVNLLSRISPSVEISTAASDSWNGGVMAALAASAPHAQAKAYAAMWSMLRQLIRCFDVPANFRGKLSVLADVQVAVCACIGSMRLPFGTAIHHEPAMQLVLLLHEKYQALTAFSNTYGAGAGDSIAKIVQARTPSWKMEPRTRSGKKSKSRRRRAGTQDAPQLSLILKLLRICILQLAQYRASQAARGAIDSGSDLAEDQFVKIYDLILDQLCEAVRKPPRSPASSSSTGSGGSSNADSAEEDDDGNTSSEEGPYPLDSSGNPMMLLPYHPGPHNNPGYTAGWACDACGFRSKGADDGDVTALVRFHSPDHQQDLCRNCGPIGAKITRPNCDGNHGLTKFVAPHDRFTCDLCGAHVANRSVLYGCRACNFDACMKCYGISDDQLATARASRDSNSHLLMALLNLLYPVRGIALRCLLRSPNARAMNALCFDIFGSSSSTPSLRRRSADIIKDVFAAMRSADAHSPRELEELPTRFVDSLLRSVREAASTKLSKNQPHSSRLSMGRVRKGYNKRHGITASYIEMLRWVLQYARPKQESTTSTIVMHNVAAALVTQLQDDLRSCVTVLRSHSQLVATDSLTEDNTTAFGVEDTVALEFGIAAVFVLGGYEPPLAEGSSVVLMPAQQKLLVDTYEHGVLFSCVDHSRGGSDFSSRDQTSEVEVIFDSSPHEKRKVALKDIKAVCGHVPDWVVACSLPQLTLLLQHATTLELEIEHCCYDVNTEYGVETFQVVPQTRSLVYSATVAHDRERSAAFKRDLANRPKKLPTLRNSAGAKMTLGSGPGASARTLYCGRPVPALEGRCGPNSGPQCPECKEYQETVGLPSQLDAYRRESRANAESRYGRLPARYLHRRHSGRGRNRADRVREPQMPMAQSWERMSLADIGIMSLDDETDPHLSPMSDSSSWGESTSDDASEPASSDAPDNATKEAVGAAEEATRRPPSIASRLAVTDFKLCYSRLSFASSCLLKEILSSPMELQPSDLRELEDSDPTDLAALSASNTPLSTICAKAILRNPSVCATIAAACSAPISLSTIRCNRKKDLEMLRQQVLALRAARTIPANPSRPRTALRGAGRSSSASSEFGSSFLLGDIVCKKGSDHKLVRDARKLLQSLFVIVAVVPSSSNGNSYALAPVQGAKKATHLNVEVESEDRLQLVHPRLLPWQGEEFENFYSDAMFPERFSIDPATPIDKVLTNASSRRAKKAPSRSLSHDACYSSESRYFEPTQRDDFVGHIFSARGGSMRIRSHDSASQSSGAAAQSHPSARVLRLQHRLQPLAKQGQTTASHRITDHERVAVVELLALMHEENRFLQSRPTDVLKGLQQQSLINDGAADDATTKQTIEQRVLDNFLFRIESSIAVQNLRKCCLTLLTAASKLDEYRVSSSDADKAASICAAFQGAQAIFQTYQARRTKQAELDRACVVAEAQRAAKSPASIPIKLWTRAIGDVEEDDAEAAFKRIEQSLRDRRRTRRPRPNEAARMSKLVMLTSTRAGIETRRHWVAEFLRLVSHRDNCGSGLAEESWNGLLKALIRVGGSELLKRCIADVHEAQRIPMFSLAKWGEGLRTSSTPTVLKRLERVLLSSPQALFADLQPEDCVSAHPNLELVEDIILSLSSSFAALRTGTNGHQAGNISLDSSNSQLALFDSGLLVTPGVPGVQPALLQSLQDATGSGNLTLKHRACNVLIGIVPLLSKSQSLPVQATVVDLIEMVTSQSSPHIHSQLVQALVELLTQVSICSQDNAFQQTDATSDSEPNAPPLFGKLLARTEHSLTGVPPTLTEASIKFKSRPKRVKKGSDAFDKVTFGSPAEAAFLPAPCSHASLQFSENNSIVELGDTSSESSSNSSGNNSAPRGMYQRFGRGRMQSTPENWRVAYMNQAWSSSTSVYWEVTIDDCRVYDNNYQPLLEIVIGVAATSQFSSRELRPNSLPRRMWGLGSARKLYKDGRNIRLGGPILMAETTIGILMDMMNGELSFFANGKPFGITFKDLKQQSNARLPRFSIGNMPKRMFDFMHQETKLSYIPFVALNCCKDGRVKISLRPRSVVVAPAPTLIDRLSSLVEGTRVLKRLLPSSDNMHPAFSNGANSNSPPHDEEMLTDCYRLWKLWVRNAWQIGYTAQNMELAFSGISLDVPGFLVPLCRSYFGQGQAGIDEGHLQKCVSAGYALEIILSGTGPRQKKFSKSYAVLGVYSLSGFDEAQFGPFGRRLVLQEAGVSHITLWSREQLSECEVCVSPHGYSTKHPLLSVNAMSLILGAIPSLSSFTDVAFHDVFDEAVDRDICALSKLLSNDQTGTSFGVAPAKLLSSFHKPESEAGSAKVSLSAATPTTSTSSVVRDVIFNALRKEMHFTDTLARAAVSVRYILLLRLNQMLRHNLSFLNLGRPSVTGVVDLILRSKSRIFSQTKLDFLKDLLVRTETPTRLHEESMMDDYAQPRTIPTIRVNRQRAAALTSSADASAIRRYSLISQVKNQLDKFPVHWLRQTWSNASNTQPRAFMVDLKGEDADDMGGPYRALFADIFHELQNRQLQKPPLFCDSPNAAQSEGEDRHVKMLNPAWRSKEQLTQLNCLGKLLGTALRCGIEIEVNLPLLVWRRLCGERPQWGNDIRQVDAGLFEALRYLEERIQERNATAKQNVTDTAEGDPMNGRVFTLPSCDRRETQLVPNGRAKPVTPQNWALFLRGARRLRLHESAAQTEELIAGLAQVIPVEPLALLTCDELTEHVCGRQDVDVDLLRRCAM